MTRSLVFDVSSLTLLVGHQEGHSICKTLLQKSLNVSLGTVETSSYLVKKIWKMVVRTVVWYVCHTYTHTYNSFNDHFCVCVVN